MTDPIQALQAMLQAGGSNDAAVPAQQPLLTASTRPSLTTRRRHDDRLSAAPLRAARRSEFALLQEHVVMQGDRLDNIAAQVSGRSGAVLAAVRRQRRDAPGRIDRNDRRRLRITLPQGIPGAPNA